MRSSRQMQRWRRQKLRTPRQAGSFRNRNGRQPRPRQRPLSAGAAAAAETTDLTGRVAGLRQVDRGARGVPPSARGAQRRAGRSGTRSPGLPRASLAAGFEGTEQAQLAVRTAEELRELVDEVRRHDDALAATRTALADPELDVPLQPAADPETAAGVVTAAVQRAQAAHALWVRLRGRLADAQAAVERAAALEQEAAPLREQAAMLDSLAELAAGGAGNRLRMSLSAFVLAARLEQVAARASVRLAAMTSGRYTLHHTDEVSDARRKHGLGLAVRDVWTGARTPHRVAVRWGDVHDLAGVGARPGGRRRGGGRRSAHRRAVHRRGLRHPG